MNEPASKPDQPERSEQPPPFLGSWRRAYLAVIAWLALLILLFYAFSRRFAP
jgi:hypothetical protein